MKRLLFAFLLVCSVFLAKADGNIMFEQANALYHSKNYDSAAQLYTQLVENGYHSNDLYYNMGNAFYRAQKVGWAVWSYRKSMKLHCGQNTLDNYRLAKKQIKDPLLVQNEIFFMRWWKSLYSLFTVNTWAVISLISFIVFLLIFFLQTVGKKRIPSFLRWSFLSIFLTGLLLMFVRYYNDINHFEGVLVESARFESKAGGQPDKIPEGSEVVVVNKELDEAYAGKILVQLSDLRQGYILKQRMKRL